MRQVKEGRLRFQYEHVGLEPMRRTLHSGANRLALAIVVGALVLGASMIVQSNVPPLVGGMPVIAIIGYILALDLGVWLAVAGLRGGSQ